MRTYYNKQKWYYNGRMWFHFLTTMQITFRHVTVIWSVSYSYNKSVIRQKCFYKYCHRTFPESHFFFFHYKYNSRACEKLPFYMRNGREVSEVICWLQEKALIETGHICFSVCSRDIQYKISWLIIKVQ